MSPRGQAEVGSPRSELLQMPQHCKQLQSQFVPYWAPEYPLCGPSFAPKWVSLHLNIFPHSVLLSRLSGVRKE